MKKKRLVALVMSMFVLVVSLVGCNGKKNTETGNISSNEPLKVLIKLKNRPDCALVSQEVSKLVEDKLGFGVELLFGYHSDKIALMLATNEQMDIGFEDYNTFVDRVRQNAYVDITDKLINHTPNLYNAIPKELWEGSKVDGRNYAVPTYKEYAEVRTALADREIIEESGIDPASVDELKDIEPVLETLKKHPERAGYEILSTSISHMYLALKNKYDIVCDNFVVNRENPEKIVHFMETQEYKDYVYMMRDWYNKGYIAKDVVTRTDYSAYDNEGNVGVIAMWYSPYAESTVADYYHTEELVPMYVTPIIKSNESMLGSMYAIYSKSKNIDNALKFLELWNTDPEVKNMITYGIEGKHYNLVNGKVKRTEGSLDLYKMDNSTSGNMMISYLLETDPDDKYEQFKNFNEKAIDSATLGFFPNTESVKSKLGACTNAVNEYNSLLCCGAVEPSQYLDKMINALKKSGVEEVKAETSKTV